MRSKDVIFKGTGRTLKVVLSEGATIEDALFSIEQKLSSNPSFYAGQRITVESKSGPIPDEDSAQIRKVFSRYNLACSVLDRKSAAEKASALLTQTVLMDEAPFIQDEASGGEGRAEGAFDGAELHRGDVIPGRSLRFESNVLVLGDVLPGSKVQAKGDVIITGIAGGEVHAGWPSDDTACIIAGGFTAGTYRVGGLELAIQEAVGSQVAMLSLAKGEEGLVVRSGDAGLLSRREEEI